ncbi:MAG: glycosyltransferase [Oscillospiraceae bacterium]|nr:glycosyltransferase [Oscillospiraceae bacterium]
MNFPAKKRPRILFVLPSLAGGGAEKSLITLLWALEARGGGVSFDADLFLFEEKGLFLTQLPPWVRLRSAGKRYELFTGSGCRALRYFLLRGRPDLLLARWRYRKAWNGPEEALGWRLWQAMRRALPRLRRQYDAAVGYLEGYANYFVIDNVKARRKIAWLHTDYRRVPSLKEADKRYLPLFDAAVSVSGACCDALAEALPALEGKIHCVENIVSPVLLRELAQAAPPPWEPPDMPVLLSIGRLVELKGHDVAVRACGILKRMGIALRWYVIGAGEREAPLRELIAEEGLADRFFLLGETLNPYPALAACDIYVQPSRFEGKSIALEEAKALAKPIVCTRFKTVRDQITEGETGLTARIGDAADLAARIKFLLERPGLQRLLRDNLTKLEGNEAQADKFLRICDIFPAF